MATNSGRTTYRRRRRSPHALPLENLVNWLFSFFVHLKLCRVFFYNKNKVKLVYKYSIMKLK